MIAKRIKIILKSLLVIVASSSIVYRRCFASIFLLFSLIPSFEPIRRVGSYIKADFPNKQSRHLDLTAKFRDGHSCSAFYKYFIRIREKQSYNDLLFIIGQ